MTMISGLPANEVFTLIYIFFARIVDQSLGTIRIILISRGYRNIAPLLGFFEVLIWLTAVSQALINMSGIHSYIVYAAGFAIGNYVGMLIESKLSIGYQSIRIITSKQVSALPLQLREEGFGVTIVEGQGLKGEVNILYTFVRKKDVKKILEIINILEPDAFITIEDVNSHQHGFILRKDYPALFGKHQVRK